MVSMCGETGHYSNKSLRSTTVTRMSLGQVPPEVGMLVTGHKRVASYQKYDCSGAIRVAVVQDIISSPYDECGQLKSYPTVLHEKINNFCHNVDGVVAGQSATGVVAGQSATCVAGVSSSTGVIKQNVVDATFVAGVSSSTGAIKENVMDASTVAGVSSYTVVGPVEHVSKGSTMEKFAGSSTVSSHVQGLKASVVSSCAVGSCSPVVPYKIGDDIPFDESLLKELPAKSVEALGFPTKSSPTLTFNNCVVNVYFNKENVPNN